MAFGNLTVDFRKLSRIPVRDRAELARSPQASEIFGNMSPSQIAQLVPSYYRNLAAGVSTGDMGGALSSGYGGGGAGSGGGGGGTSSGTAAPINKPPARPGLIEDILQKGGQGAVGSASRISGNFSPRQKAVLEFIGKREGARDPNIIFGGERYKSRLGLDTKPLTERTISEVINEIMPKLRQLSKADGYGRTNDGRIVGTSAVGTGQMIEGTLKTNLAALGIPEKDWDKIKFDENLQYQLTLANFKTSGIGDPNASPSTWNLQALAQQYESLNPSRGHTPMTREEMLAIENASAEISETIPGATPVDSTSPVGADQGDIIPLLQGGESAATATVAPAGEVAQRTMILSLGTNDWDNSASTYQNAIDAIKAAQEKGYKVVVVPPVGDNSKFQKVHDLVVQAANESGASIEQPQSYSPDGYHPTGDEYKRIGEKYPGAVVVGDSIANGIGRHVVGGQTVAKDGMGSSVIRTNVLSDDVPVNTTPASPQTQTFNVEIFSQIDPRIKKLYDEMPPEKRVLLERALTNLGAAEVNRIAEKYPTASPIAVGDAVDGMYSNVIEKQQQVAGVRRGAITQELKESLSYAADQASDDRYKVELVVTSGGQRMEGAEGATGSHRHDEGGAGDFNAYLINRETGERILLDPRNPDHTSYIAKTTTAFARVHPSAGVGALYMDDPTKIHFGGDDVSEHGGRARGPLAYAGPDWFKQAHAAGVAQQQQDNEDGYKPKDEWRQKKIEAQSKQVAPTPLGTEPVTPAPQQNDTAVIPLQQGQQSATPAPSGPAPADIPAPEATPNMKLGGMANLVDEQMTVRGADGQGFNFNQNEEVNIKDGKATVQNEYQKQAQETKTKTDTGMPQPQNQGSMKSSSSTNDFQGQAKYAVVPHSPSAQRHFDASRFNDKHFRGNGARNGT